MDSEASVAAIAPRQSQDRPPERTRPTAGATDGHTVQFYETEEFLANVVAAFVAKGLAAHEVALVIATEPHRDLFSHHLLALGVDVARALREDRLVFLDARETLSAFMVEGMPDGELFHAEIGGRIVGLLGRRGTGAPAALRAYGEMVDLLWRDGNSHAAIRLEEMWNELGHCHRFSLLCAYGMGHFHRAEHGPSLAAICEAHAQVGPTESCDPNPQDLLRQVTLLQQRARALESEIEQRKRLEDALREALVQRRRAEEELRLNQLELTDFFENAVEGLHKVGPDGSILWANRAELEMLGYSEAEYIGHHISEFYVDANLATGVLARLTSNETVKDFETALKHKDGSVRHVLINSNARFDEGKFVYSRCFTRDVTDRKRLEEELRQQNDDLARTVRFSETFVGILGHDLRNPLSAITTAASLLSRRADSERVAKPATRILNSGRRMARMIDQLLDFTRIRLGRGIPLTRGQIDLAEVCRLSLDEVESVDRAEVGLEAVGDVTGSWDGDRLSQLVSNLLGNALAHGSPGAPVRVRIDGSRTHAVHLEVHNQGEIPVEMRAVLFEPLKNPTDRKQERSSGLGLGLYISQQIVVAHAGTIEVVSSAHEGTRVIVRLPRTSRANEPAFETSLRESASRESSQRDSAVRELP